MTVVVMVMIMIIIIMTMIMIIDITIVLITITLSSTVGYTTVVVVAAMAAGGKWCKLKAVEINLNSLFLPRSSLLSPLGEARSKWGVSEDQEETLGRKATWDISEPRKCRRNISEL